MRLPILSLDYDLGLTDVKICGFGKYIVISVFPIWYVNTQFREDLVASVLLFIISLISIGSLLNSRNIMNKDQ